MLTVEGNDYAECYADNMPTSLASARRKQAEQNISIIHKFFANKSLVNWGMFSAPKNPMILQLLHHIVDVVKRLFLKEDVFYRFAAKDRFRRVVCTTGPGALTAVVMSELLKLHISTVTTTNNNTAIDGNLTLGVRVVARDFSEFGIFIFFYI